MGNAFIAYNNLVDDATITTDSEVSSLPLENVKYSHLTRVWRTSASSAYVQIDAGTATASDLLFMGGVSFAAGTTIRVRASNTAFTTGDLLDINSGFSINETYDNVLRVFSSTVTARYWRIDITASAAFDVGRIMLLQKIQPSINIGYPFAITWIDPSEKRRMEGGQVNTYKRSKYRVSEFGWKSLQEADAIAELFSKIDRISGISENVLFIYDKDGTYLHEKMIYGFLSQVGQVSHPRYGTYRKDYRITEEL